MLRENFAKRTQTFDQKFAMRRNRNLKYHPESKDVIKV